ncbi:hypothetical protein [Chelativorans sp. AA-79]|uniref:hypothetical protein n=1 Tax=Chelativorans sp. AA-79 TaxID=3028735 RepID=UPI0023F6A703|nr:hypothetical protein [Chelativorans sp. AA-79]WEX12467.1 hypothetical protein PVE73_27475 [Chelativorans sp. AA-79]
MQFIAEGIETEDQANKLAYLGCTLGQGYRCGRPASAATTLELLHRFSQRPDSSSTYKVLYRLRA